MYADQLLMVEENMKINELFSTIIEKTSAGVATATGKRT
jgi:hypothetical protein